MAEQQTPEKDLCPTLCDDDCDTDCHEWHEVTAKRSHQPEDCPAIRPGKTSTHQGVER